MRHLPLPFLTLLAVTSHAVLADTEVQEGGLSGSAGAPEEHVIRLHQFDPQDGSRTLQMVEMEFFTGLFAEAVTSGEPGWVTIQASLDADYSYADGTPIAETATLVQDELDNSDGPLAISYLDEDIATVSLESPRSLAPWIGTGEIELGAVVLMLLEESPEGLLWEFLASGVVQYRVVYHFDPAPPCPTDLDGDGITGGADLGAFMSFWGGCDACAADFNDDGRVDGVDLGAMFAAWGPCG